MWPRRSARPLIRIGAKRVELWERAGAGYRCAQFETLRAGAGGFPQDLESGLARFESLRTSRVLEPDVVVESACMPIVTAWIGRRLMREDLIRSWLRQRVVDMYGETGWQVRTNHRVGQTLAVGFALDGRMRSAIEKGLAAHGSVPHTLAPCLLWSRSHFSRRYAGRPEWRVCIEQDRSLISCEEGGEMVSLNAGAGVIAGTEQLSAQLQAETVRHGLTAARRNTVVMAWHRVHRVSDQEGGLTRWNFVETAQASPGLPSSVPVAMGNAR